MNKVHKPRLDTATYEALKLRAAYIKQRTGQHITVGQTIRWLVCGKLVIKGEGV